MSEELMTRAEWIRHEEKRDCANGGHAPSSRFSTDADPVGWFRCECGGVTWKPQRRAPLLVSAPLPSGSRILRREAKDPQ